MRSKGKNYKDGYYSNIYRQKFGVWPKGLRNITKPVSLETRNFIKAKQIRYAKRKEKESKQ